MRPKLLALLLLFFTLFVISQTSSDNSEEEDSEDFYEETVVLKTKSGSLRGRKEVVNSNSSYYSFKGIRYAKAPTGEGRFQVKQMRIKLMISLTEYFFLICIIQM